MWPENFEKRATDVAVQLDESVRLITKVEELAKLAIEKCADMKRQVTRSVKPAEDAPRQLTHLWRRVELLEEEA